MATEPKVDVDLVVIGAGPGGGSAALHASRLGLSVMVLEADPEIGTPFVKTFKAS